MKPKNKLLTKVTNIDSWLVSNGHQTAELQENRPYVTNTCEPRRFLYESEKAESWVQS